MSKIQYNPPILAILTGVPGSGKSSISTGIYDASGKKIENGIIDLISACYMDKDDINNAFTSERESPFYDIVRKGTYNVIDQLAKANLRLGNSVWIDATYAGQVKNPNWADKYNQICQENGASLKLMRTVVPEHILKQRILARGFERDNSKLTDWENFLIREPIHVKLPYSGIEIDTTLDHKQNLEMVLEFLGKK